MNFVLFYGSQNTRKHIRYVTDQTPFRKVIAVCIHLRTAENIHRCYFMEIRRATGVEVSIISVSDRITKCTIGKILKQNSVPLRHRPSTLDAG